MEQFDWKKFALETRDIFPDGDVALFIDLAVRKHRQENPKASYAEVMTKLLAADPKLKEAYGMRHLTIQTYFEEVAEQPGRREIAGDKLDLAVAKFRAINPAFSYSDALRAVVQAHPDLADEYRGVA